MPRKTDSLNSSILNLFLKKQKFLRNQKTTYCVTRKCPLREKVKGHPKVGGKRFKAKDKKVKAKGLKDKSERFLFFSFWP